MKRNQAIENLREAGITLIALVITIVILLILAGISINALSDNGLFGKAKQAKADMAQAQEEEDAELKEYEDLISMYDGSDPTLAGKTASGSNRLLSGEKGEDADGKYTYKNPVIPQGFSAVDDGARWTYKDKNTLDEVTGWNDGLVIQDSSGNQFVWVPVDGTNVTYAKWCTAGIAYNDSNISDASDSYQDGAYNAIPVSDETAQISKYGGFYVARFEAGYANATNDYDESTHANDNTTGTAVSKKGSKVWNYISYNNAVVVADKMINNSAKYGTVKSGLITGTQWDTIMKWYKNSGIGIGETDGTAQDWGTYADLTYTIQAGSYYFTIYKPGSRSDWRNDWLNNESITREADTTRSGTNPFVFHGSGLNSNGYKKNIADMAGNFYEWTSSEAYLYEFTGEEYDCRVQRGGGGSYAISLSNVSVTERSFDVPEETSYECGFRCVLYIE